MDDSLLLEFFDLARKLNSVLGDDFAFLNVHYYEDGEPMVQSFTRPSGKCKEVKCLGTFKPRVSRGGRRF